jgi:4-amino-4-deoxy-L-arabinose transferase-like glycosyltransferase
MHASPVHTPFVPFTSALMMLLFGESRIVAEAVLPIFTAVWLIGTFAVVRRLYGVGTALWTSALVGTFPVFLIYSRTYLFEHPLAAVFTCACWALLASDGFSRPWPSAAFGVLAGLTCLTRGGAPVYLAGPLTVTLWSIRARSDRARRVRLFAASLLIAVALAATWYGPNAATLASYIYRATYGQDAVRRIGGGFALSAANAWYYVTWIVAQGPGTPMAAMVMAGGVAAWMLARRLPSFSPITVGLSLVLGIDFFMLLLAAQHEAARYFQPLMAVMAVAIVRTVATMPQRAMRLSVGTVTVVLAAQHLLALTGTAQSAWGARAPYAAGVPLWDHASYFAGVTDFYNVHPVSQDCHIAETINLLAGERLPADAVIATLETPHPFFQPNGLQLEAVKRDFKWRFVWVPFLDNGHYDATARALAAMPIDAVLLRMGGQSLVDVDAMTRAFPGLFDPHEPTFQHVDRSLVLGDGSRVSLYVNPYRMAETRHAGALRPSSFILHP